MNERKIKIYKALFSDLICTKESLTKILDVSSIKTVENNIKDIEDIEYDKKLRRYRFKNLLPNHIPNEVFFDIFKSSIVNKLLKNDFLLLEKDISSLKTNEMINTDQLSTLAKKIIMFKNAIKDNCVLEVEYKKVGKEIETKIIRPHTVFSNGFTYYVYVTYDELNEDNIGEERTFAFNAIGKIKPVNYLNNEVLKKVQKGNAYGSFKKDKFILLNLNKYTSNFFKREILFNNDAFEMIDEDIGNETITVKMYYNDIFEVVKIIQQWMPQIKIQNDSELKREVYSKVQKNISNLLEE